jgi:hypothetical protein
LILYIIKPFLTSTGFEEFCKCKAVSGQIFPAGVSGLGREKLLMRKPGRFSPVSRG